MYAKMRALFDAAPWRERTMYVIPYSMGVVSWPFSKIGIRNHQTHLCRAFHAL